MIETIKIAGVVKESITDGPGIRFAIFSQGCPHHCKGCHNEATWSFEGGVETPVDKILAEIDKDPLLRGVTFSGGEPFSQPEGFLALARKLKNRPLDIVIFTGYRLEELEKLGEENPAIKELLDRTDLLIDGRYIAEKRNLGLRFRGSENQRIIDMNKTRKNGRLTLAKEYMM